MLSHGLSFEAVMLVGSALLLISVLASRISSTLGIPVLVFFLGVGMLAGSDGPGGIHFDDAGLARNIGTICLAFILFSGGLDTEWKTLRPVAWPSLALATIGVAISTGLIALFASLFGIPLLEGLLLGAIVSSTDASALFGVLRGRGIKLKGNLDALLEMESGSNDPMAVFLTVGITSLIIGKETSAWSLLPSFFLEMAVGSALGVAFGLGTTWLINRITLDYEGLYPVLTLAAVIATFFGTQMLHGSGFLAVYVAGVVMGSREFLHKETLKTFHDGLGWLMQVVMFLALGLLVFPSHLPAVFVSGIAVAAFLVLIARPIAVFITLAPFRNISSQEKAFVSWVGLRGAVPIVLATIPLTAGVRSAERLFDLVFFVVVSSVLLQGTTIGSVASRLGVISSAKQKTQPATPSQ